MLSKFFSFILIRFIKAYQLFISPVWHVLAPGVPGGCRYLPTCSEYGVQAIDKYGPFKGSWLAFKRIMRCHPWGGHGFDPVP